MVEQIRCRIKMEVLATEWVNHGDHPAVQRLPEQIQLPPGHNRDVWGCIQTSKEIKCFPPHTYIIEVGGNTFAVDKQYYEDFYEPIVEIVGVDG